MLIFTGNAEKGGCGCHKNGKFSVWGGSETHPLLKIFSEMGGSVSHLNAKISIRGTSGTRRIAKF